MMIMKKFATLFLTVFFCSSLFAEDINMNNKDKGSGGMSGSGGAEHDKELVVGVSASIEDGVLTIATDVATHGVVVSIYDSSCVVVYTSVSEIEGKTHEFVVGEQPSGDYILEVEIGDTLTSGEFTIDWEMLYL